MKSKVEPIFVPLLESRAYISRHIRVFTIPDIAEAWTISPRTLLRYISEEDRELSRAAAKKRNLAYKTVDKSKCQICFSKLQGHARCKHCTMLIHGQPECSCNGCIDTLVFIKLIS